MIVPRPSVRAFAVAAALALACVALLLVPTDGVLRTVLVVGGIVLLALAGALIGLAVATARRQRVTISLDEAGYRVDSPAGVRGGTWKDVTRVTAGPGRITLHQGDAERVHLVAPDGRLPQFEALAGAISKRLDDDRGYRIWTG